MKIIDLHEDIILTFDENPDAFFTEEGKELKPLYHAGWFADYKDRFDLVFGAIWPYGCEGDMTDPKTRVITFTPQCIDTLLDGYLSWWSQMPIVKSKADLDKPGCKLLIHLEWHDTISSVTELKALYDKWVRSFGWTWNHDTTLSGGNCSQEKGLTPLGREVMKAMNDWWMIIDTAHMSRQGMRELLQNSTKPILNSHSNLYTLLEHPRNLPDDIIDLFPANGGVIGISIYWPFINADPEVMIDTYLDQVAYVINRIGDDYIWLGTDRHGIPKAKAVKWLDTVTWVDLLYTKMLERFGSVTTQKFFYDNARRVLEANLS